MQQIATVFGGGGPHFFSNIVEVHGNGSAGFLQWQNGNIYSCNRFFHCWFCCGLQRQPDAVVFWHQFY